MRNGSHRTAFGVFFVAFCLMLLSTTVHANGNTAPVAVNDHYTVDAGASLSVPAPGLLGNDYDADGDALVQIEVAWPTDPPYVAALNVSGPAVGHFTLTPSVGYSGITGFSYRVQDSYGSWSNWAGVVIEVIPNTLPVAVDDHYAVDAGASLSVPAPGLLGNDYDADGDALVQIEVAWPTDPPYVAALNVSGPAVGHFTLTPIVGYSGITGFSYRVQDSYGSWSNWAGVVIEVIPNTLPVAVNDHYTVDAGASLSVPAPGLLGNDYDADGDALVQIEVAWPTDPPYVAALNVSGPAVGHFTLTPIVGYSGITGFSYRVQDSYGSWSNWADVVVEVTSRLGTLGDFVWLDQDYDGIQDSGEPGVAGALVELYAGDGTWLAATTTDATGLYLFDGLDPGEYYVKFYAPYGYAFTRPDEGSDDTLDSDADTSLGETAVVTLAAGESNLTLDAGIYELFKICGFKYIGADETVPGAGWTIELYKDFGGDEPAWVPMGTAITDADGKYCFERLYAGDYRVVEVLQDGWLRLSPQGGHELNLPDESSDREAGPFYNFHNVQSASVGNYVWWDYDHDGIQDGGDLEPGIAGVTVELWECEGTAALDSTLTDEDGYYLFDDLMPGDYYLKFILPDGYMFTQQDAGSDDDLDSDANATTGATACTTLDPGEGDMSWDAGMYMKWRTDDSATGSGTRITLKKSSTWFMYNFVDASGTSGSYTGSVATFDIQAGNPMDGENIVGKLTVSKTAPFTFQVTYALDECIERNGSLWHVTDCSDAHLSIGNTASFKANPGRDDNQDFGVEFTDYDKVFYMFAHLVVCYE